MKNINEKINGVRKQILNVDAEVEFLFAAPKLRKDRDRLVLSDRFGLSGKKPKTLEEIGKSLGITRERVRQIEKNGLKKLSDFLATDLRGQEISSVLIKNIKDNGYIVSTKDFLANILGDNVTEKEVNQLSFIVACCRKIFIHLETTSMYRSYYIEPMTNQMADKIESEAVKILKTENKPVEEQALIKKLYTTLKDTEKPSLVAAVGISKNILKTESGHLGLIHWRDINPKSIKDKTYYILKKHKKPLHYTEIAKHIQNFGDKGKLVTRQAVHNELIRDDRFILIGRGIYALSEWGYQAGVVEEVIETVLIEAGRPMHKDDIIDEVLKRRIVKETTILLNLQKDRFKRVSRATYTVSNGRE